MTSKPMTQDDLTFLGEIRANELMAICMLAKVGMHDLETDVRRGRESALIFMRLLRADGIELNDLTARCQSMIDVLSANRVDTATGEDLDRLGSLVGVKRDDIPPEGH